MDKLAFYFFSRISIQVGDGDQVMLIKHSLVNAELGRVKPNHGRASTFAVASITHLKQRLQQMSAGQ
jgi:hypothetical protein